MTMIYQRVGSRTAPESSFVRRRQESVFKTRRGRPSSSSQPVIPEQQILSGCQALTYPWVPGGSRATRKVGRISAFWCVVGLKSRSGRSRRISTEKRARVRPSTRRVVADSSNCLIHWQAPWKRRSRNSGRINPNSPCRRYRARCRRAPWRRRLCFLG